MKENNKVTNRKTHFTTTLDSTMGQEIYLELHKVWGTLKAIERVIYLIYKFYKSEFMLIWLCLHIFSLQTHWGKLISKIKISKISIFIRLLDQSNDLIDIYYLSPMLSLFRQSMVDGKIDNVLRSFLCNNSVILWLSLVRNTTPFPVLTCLNRDDLHMCNFNLWMSFSLPQNLLSSLSFFSPPPSPSLPPLLSFSLLLTSHPPHPYL